ncbi:hypothetical protein EUAN_02670 [Andreesenia angusta]|uniref:BREX-3 system P-loop-containing protein BrxF n=1 Tax=Andreesenia angusta TaxID=39480 RepID=A0A1S1V9W2_9FIRM|nr:BREX-3 system P-loop-containing protein BrxF [Andreesenia angusta]OHW63403.1 hypothetical protein EUAN_02670 [Andreesenia angusta]
MGYVHKLSSLNSKDIGKMMFPVFFCLEKTKVEDFLECYEEVSLNRVLSERLLAFEKEKRAIHILNEIEEIFNNSGELIFITDFEMLFNPDYKIDILKLFIKLSRKKKVMVLWPGVYENEALKFAELGYQDYKSYRIKDYDITCIN